VCIKPDATPNQQTRVSQWASLVVKLGALAFAVYLPRTFSINLQLLGGIWILQVFPSIVFGLFTRWFHGWALLAGWLGGMIFGTIAAYKVATPPRRTGPGRLTSSSATRSTSACPRSSSTSRSR
jgi:solute:Na+ symporter, SSS family